MALAAKLAVALLLRSHSLWYAYDRRCVMMMLLVSYEYGVCMARPYY